MRMGLGLGLYRPLKIAAAVAAGPGPELWVQPTFAASTGLTLGNWVFSTGSVTAADSDVTFCSATALGTLTAGTYRVAYTIAANPESRTFQVQIGGTGANLGASPNTVGVHSADAVIASVSTQVIRFRDPLGDADVLQLTAFSVKLLS